MVYGFGDAELGRWKHSAIVGGYKSLTATTEVRSPRPLRGCRRFEIVGVVEEIHCHDHRGKPADRTEARRL